MSSELDEVVALFRDESQQRLDHMVELLLAVERGDAPADAVDTLFRDAHTIKGGAGMLGLAEVEAIAHGLEDVLQEARNAGALDVAPIESVLESVDRIRALIATADPVFPELGEPAAPEPAVAPTVRVAHTKIDRLLDAVGESMLHHRRLDHLTPPSPELDDELLEGERLLAELKETAIAMRTLPLATVTAALPRAVRDAARDEGKLAELHIDGGEIELDRAILETLGEPLAHLLRNAVAHGIEPPDARVAAGKPRTGRVELRAAQRGAFVEVVVADDGRGVAPELLEQARHGTSLVDLLARPGFSTAAAGGTLAGRGVGLDAVKGHVEQFGGSLDVRSTPGAGTEIVLLLPLALALLDVVLVSRGGQTFGLPMSSVDEVTDTHAQTVLQGRRTLLVRGEAVELFDLADAVGADATDDPQPSVAMVVGAAGRRRALACDALLGTEEVVVKPLRPLLGSLQHYLGAAIRGDGSIALLVDPAAVVRATPARRRAVAAVPVAATRETVSVLVVEDSFTVRELQRSILETAGYDVQTAQDGVDALDRLAQHPEISLVVTDVEMPRCDGLELTRAIRADVRHSALPVVVVTSLASEEHRQAGLEAGADAYVVKQSFDQRGLLDTIERLVGR